MVGPPGLDGFFFIIIIGAIMVCHVGQLVVTQGPCVSLVKCEQQYDAV